jgi:hypothetical protein
VEPRLKGLSSVAKTALSGLLVVLFLLSGTLAASTALHESLHKDPSASHHLCLVCLFAKGQVSAADVAVIAGLLILIPVFGPHIGNAAPLPAFDYRLAPSRAPPAT